MSPANAILYMLLHKNTALESCVIETKFSVILVSCDWHLSLGVKQCEAESRGRLESCIYRRRCEIPPPPARPFGNSRCGDEQVAHGVRATRRHGLCADLAHLFGKLLVTPRKSDAIKLAAVCLIEPQFGSGVTDSIGCFEGGVVGTNDQRLHFPVLGVWTKAQTAAEGTTRIGIGQCLFEVCNSLFYQIAVHIVSVLWTICFWRCSLLSQTNLWIVLCQVFTIFVASRCTCSFFPLVCECFRVWINFCIHRSAWASCFLTSNGCSLFPCEIPQKVYKFRNLVHYREK